MATQLMKNKGVILLEFFYTAKLHCRISPGPISQNRLVPNVAMEKKKKRKKKRGLPSASCLLLAAQYLGWLASVTL